MTNILFYFIYFYLAEGKEVLEESLSLTVVCCIYNEKRKERKEKREKKKESEIKKSRKGGLKGLFICV